LEFVHTIDAKDVVDQGVFIESLNYVEFVSGKWLWQDRYLELQNQVGKGDFF
jgi:hypothetical protein